MRDYPEKFKRAIRRRIAKARHELELADKAIDAGEWVTNFSWAMDHAAEAIRDAALAAENGDPDIFDDEDDDKDDTDYGRYMDPRHGR